MIRFARLQNQCRILYNTIRSTHADRGQLQNAPKEAPVKFTTSTAHVGYKAAYNFHGDDRDLPPSHNLVLAASLISSLFYLYFLRDPIGNDGGFQDLVRPIHETFPELAVPMLEAAIVENRRAGRSTKKLEQELAKYKENPETYRKQKKKLVEN